LDNRRRRLAFFSVLAGTVLLLWSPYIFQDPLSLVRHLLAYRSQYGHWGFSFLSADLLGEDSWFSHKFRKWGALLLLAAIAVVSVWMNRVRPKPSLFSQLGLVFFFHLFFTNGFGVQHLVWLIPWAVPLGTVPAIFFYATSGAFLFLVYNYWSAGLPWYLADAIRVGDYQGHLDYFQLLCWLSVLYLLVSAWRRIQPVRAIKSQRIHIPLFARRASVALAALALVICPTVLQWQRDSHPPGRPNGEQAARVMRATEFSEVSSRLLAAKRYPEAIATARQALALDPNNAEANNTLAALSQAVENSRSHR
jgi:hypothetical protein